MAAFSTLGLIGAGMAAGSAIGGLLSKRKQNQQQTLAPGPTNAGQDALAPPAPPIVDPAEANMTARQAGIRQRKRAAQGSLLTAPVSKSTTPGVAARYAKPTLLGS